MTTALKNIAIADDEPGIRRLFEDQLPEFQYHVTGSVQNGAEALELVRAAKPQLIILDVHMPVMDGLEAARQILALGTTAVVLVTGDYDPQIAQKAMDMGVSGFLLKPFDNGQIQAILEMAWNRFEAVRSLSTKVRELDEALELRKLTEKAKGILMEQQGFSEPEAHRMLQKLSQDQGLPMKEVCRSLIQVRMVLGKKSDKSVRNRF